MAKVGDPEKMDGMRRLSRFVEADFGAAMAHERKISKAVGGRTVFDDRQMKLV